MRGSRGGVDARENGKRENPEAETGRKKVLSEPEFTPILFAGTSDMPNEISPQGIKVAKLITILEAKGFFGGIQIDMQSGKITNSGIKQTIRI